MFQITQTINGNGAALIWSPMGFSGEAWYYAQTKCFLFVYIINITDYFNDQINVAFKLFILSKCFFACFSFRTYII